MPCGCALAAVGILASEPLITVQPHFWLLAARLAVAGLGIGAAIVPVTSIVLELVPAEHSGMAASNTNTARQLGVVFGSARSSTRSLTLRMVRSEPAAHQQPVPTA
jgi:predicted MFS family arabinose efflux permease